MSLRMTLTSFWPSYILRELLQVNFSFVLLKPRIYQRLPQASEKVHTAVDVCPSSRSKMEVRKHQAARHRQPYRQCTPGRQDRSRTPIRDCRVATQRL